MIHLFRLVSRGPRRRTAYRPYGEEVFAACVFALSILVLSAQSLLAHDFTLGKIEIDHPWSRATPGGATVGAGYLVLKNAGPADRLVAASSPVAERTEIHEMAMTNGVMTMRPLPGGLPLPANGSVALKPGSYHLMFIGLKRQLMKGDVIDGTLTFEKAGTVAVKFNVDAIGAPDSEHGHSHSGK